MRFGVFSVADAYPGPSGHPPVSRYRELLDLARSADALGFAHFWVGEHHFHAGGVVPSPPVLLSAIAAQTRRIRLGPLVAVLPLHDPVRLAEEYAMVDQLSDGRLELGLGSGYVAREFRAWGLDPRTRSEQFRRQLPEFLGALGGEGFSTAAAGETATINVRPVQPPTPPVWVAAGRPEAVREVGRAGLGLALIPYATLPALEDLEALVASYREGLPFGIAPRVLAAFHVGLASDDRAPISALQRFMDSRPTSEDPRLAAHRASHPALAMARGVQAAGLTLIGARPEIRARVEWLESIGVTDVAGIFDFGGLTPRQVGVSLTRWSEAFGLQHTAAGVSSGPAATVTEASA
jgi:alkanesulfonate monooxygenase SsuD/methylene tetrahydromethanopterin reductase-like flavin-dependent oxidoreductase (luciferase family)